MSYLSEMNGRSEKASMVIGDCYRITVLTEQLFRLEYSEDSIFEDRPTKFAFHRMFPVCEYQIWETEEQIEIRTNYLSLFYDKKKFSPNGLSIKVRSASHGIYSTWHYGDILNENLGGTVRTLDQADGAIPLENGIQSRLQGYSVIDDSNTVVLLENGWFEAKENKGQDLYFFGYGIDYKKCLHDYFVLTGKTPFLPRWTLGNWWSRFYPYSADSYKKLMEQFKQEKIPLAVSVIDMDWHITEVDPKDGKGWTGYTWNKQLFPNPKEFLTWLHESNLKVTLNLHPAEGIQPHEERYEEVCELLSKDSDAGQAIPFDFCNPDFIKVYFENVLHPLEEQGVDFWWVDWQQGNVSKFQGADPLWLLNHYHFADSEKDGNRPITFSRYAGPGSHRYPIGFSGDTVISWDSLKFQPYFTATAANIGYGWWSHDVGGHCAGAFDEELMVRWLQFGVFSPIMRLHSTSNLFNGKEPWNYGETAEKIMKRYLQLRHRLIPYLYTENWNCHKNNTVLIRPMYYEYPDCSESYEVSNQYLFGEKLIVSPVTSPDNTELGLGKTVVWLPEKEKFYYDFFTGVRYRGGRKLFVHRALKDIPVFAEAGTMIPLADEVEAGKNGVALPQKMELKFFAGNSGTYSMYEDDGLTMKYKEGACSVTEFEAVWNPEEVFIKIVPQIMKKEFMPDTREYTVSIVGVEKSDQIVVESLGQQLDFEGFYEEEYHTLKIAVQELSIENPVTVHFPEGLTLADNEIRESIYKLLAKAKIEYELKEKIYRIVCSERKKEHVFHELMTMGLSKDLLSAVSEILFSL